MTFFLQILSLENPKMEPYLLLHFQAIGKNPFRSELQKKWICQFMIFQMSRFSKKYSQIGKKKLLGITQSSDFQKKSLPCLPHPPLSWGIASLLPSWCILYSWLLLLSLLVTKAWESRWQEQGAPVPWPQGWAGRAREKSTDLGPVVVMDWDAKRCRNYRCRLC